MGSIQVGKSGKKIFNDNLPNPTVAMNGKKNEEKQMTKEEKAAIVKNIMQLPKDKIVPALRSKGFDDIADVVESEMAAAAEEERKAKERIEKLDAIYQLPREEQLAALLEAGFDDEAKLLSEELEKEKNGQGSEIPDGGKTDAGEGAEGPTPESETAGEGAGESEDATGDAHDEEPEKRKPGRPKKNEEV